MSQCPMLVASALLFGAFSSMCHAQNAFSKSASQARWHALLGVLTDDMLAKRAVGSAAHARATELLRAELALLTEQSAGRVTHTAHEVPFETITPDSARSSIAVQGKLAFGIDYVPLSGFGIEPPDLTESTSRFVALWPRGGSTPPSGGPNGRFAVMPPPNRSDGEPEYQLNALSPLLRAAGGSPVVFVMTRDLMPRRIVDRLLGPRLVLQTEKRAERSLPSRATPVVAITRSLASHLVRGGQSNHRGSVRLAFRRDSLLHRSYNLVAVLPGQDSITRSEFVVLVAHLDTYEAEQSHGRESDAGSSGTAARAPLANTIRPVSLLALAHELAASKVPLRRSVLFLWTSGYDRGQLGFRHFLDARTEATGSITTIIDVDELGGVENDRLSSNLGLTVVTPQTGMRAAAILDSSSVFSHASHAISNDPYAPDGCNSVIAQAAQRGISALAIRATRPATSSLPQERRLSAEDIAGLSARIDASANLVRALANADATVASDVGPRFATCIP